MAKVRFDRTSPAYLAAERKFLGRSGYPKKRFEALWKQLLEDPRAHGVKFQPISGSRPRVWKCRIDLRWHIVFRQEEDADGLIFVAFTIAHHDDY